jgi:hypothetical protein
LRDVSGFESRIDHIYRALLARTPDETEMPILQRSFEAISQRYQADPAAARELIAVGETPPAEGLAAPELATWTVLASQVLNLDETITK